MLAPVRHSSSLLEVSGLRKTVPGGRTLFAGLELSLSQGEFVAIMGESGAGKSTLLNLIAGLDTADEGSITIEGQALGGLTDDERTRLLDACTEINSEYIYPLVVLALSTTLSVLTRPVPLGHSAPSIVAVRPTTPTAPVPSDVSVTASADPYSALSLRDAVLARGIDGLPPVAHDDSSSRPPIPSPRTATWQ